MRRATAGLHLGNKSQKAFIAGKRAVFNRQINRAQIHRHHTARADIGMAHLGIAHLPGWQAHLRPKGRQRRMRAIRPNFVEIRHMRLRGGACYGVCIDPPAIQNTQNNGLAGHCGTFPKSAALLALRRGQGNALRRA